ncbi:MAG TPA: alkaline phosphatase family protein [Candidatus Cybelea sp.]|nr:alkaline phosphatase family protein [Candidatus Cybelea sp.]
MRSRALCGCALAATVAAAGCGGSTAPAVPVVVQPQHVAPKKAATIQHIIVMVQENRTFNDLFATFPGTDGTTTGLEKIGSQTQQIALKKVPLEATSILRHTYGGYLTAYDGGRMDAFNLIIAQSSGKKEGSAPYQYVDPSDLGPYWDIADNYAIADHTFQTQGSGSYTAHQDLIRGGTEIDASDSIIDDPTKMPWGCPSKSGAVTSLITTGLKYEENAGPFPCTTDFPSSGSNYRTLQNLLDAKSVSWKYYTPAWQGNTGGLWNAFLTIDSVYGNQSEWNAHISQPETNVFSDISGGTLPSVSWVIPDGVNSDHPGYSSDTGPSWVASVVDAVGESAYWNSTAVVIVWDDWGGFYDNVSPPKLDQQGGPGFRVPMLVVAPYVKRKEITHKVYEFGSIVRFIEDTWHLGRLGTTDTTANSIAPIFDFKMSPRTFTKIPSSYSRAFFLHQKPSGLPVDTE